MLVLHMQPLRYFLMAASLEIRADGFVIDEGLLERLRLFVADSQQLLSLQLQDCEAITIASDYSGFVRNFDTGFGPHEQPEVSERALAILPELGRLGRPRHNRSDHQSSIEQNLKNLPRSHRSGESRSKPWRSPESTPPPTPSPSKHRSPAVLARSSGSTQLRNEAHIEEIRR
jgi:hypothetical protein